MILGWTSDIVLIFLSQVTNMAEKVPSFKAGGAYWFVDLTTPDSLYILPVLTALTFLITVEVSVNTFRNILNTKKNGSFFISPRLDWSGMCWTNLLLD